VSSALYREISRWFCFMLLLRRDSFFCPSQPRVWTSPTPFSFFLSESAPSSDNFSIFFPFSVRVHPELGQLQPLFPFFCPSQLQARTTPASFSLFLSESTSSSDISAPFFLFSVHKSRNLSFPKLNKKHKLS
jgi:hypothetical protein